MPSIRRHPMMQSLFAFRGNQKVSLYTEPLWGIPYNLFVPYVSMYMFALGLDKTQIGLISTIFMACQCVTALLSGVLVDKWGRRRSNLIFDLIAWSIPPLLWALSQNFWWFVVAAVFNSITQCCNTSWSCLLVEDGDSKHLVNLYNWITIAGQISVFFVPIAGLLVGRLGVIPAVRILYIFAFLSMTAKAIAIYIGVRESDQGRRRVEESRGVPIHTMLRNYLPVLRNMLRSRIVLLTLAIMLLLQVCITTNNNFFSLFITQDLGIAPSLVSVFPMVRAVVMMVFFFVLQPALDRFPLRLPMMAGFALFIVADLVLILSPHNGTLWFPILSVFIEASGYAMVFPRRSALIALAVDPKERARIMALLAIFMIGLASPFGYIGGSLGELDLRWPFVLIIALSILGMICTLCIPKDLGAEDSHKL